MIWICVFFSKSVSLSPIPAPSPGAGSTCLFGGVGTCSSVPTSHPHTWTLLSFMAPAHSPLRKLWWRRRAENKWKTMENKLFTRQEEKKYLITGRPKAPLGLRDQLILALGNHFKGAFGSEVSWQSVEGQMGHEEVGKVSEVFGADSTWRGEGQKLRRRISKDQVMLMLVSSLLNAVRPSLAPNKKTYIYIYMGKKGKK